MGEAEVEEVEPEVVAEAEVVSVVEEEVVAVAEVNVVEAEVEEAVSVEVVAAEVVVAEAEAVALEEDTLAEAIVTLRTRLFPTNTTQLIFRHSHHRTLLMKVPNTLIITNTHSSHLHPNLRMLEGALRTDQHQLPLRSRERHIDSPPVLQQYANLLLNLLLSPHVLLHVTSHQRHHNTLLVATLESVHRRHLQTTTSFLPAMRLVSTHHTTHSSPLSAEARQTVRQQRHLRRVRRNHADIAARNASVHHPRHQLLRDPRLELVLVAG